MCDFNAHWDGVVATYSDLAAWTADSCLKSGVEDLCTTSMISLDTFIRGETPSQIDHILTSSDDMLELMGFGCGTGGIWHIHKDHVPYGLNSRLSVAVSVPLLAPRRNSPRNMTPSPRRTSTRRKMLRSTAHNCCS